VGAILAVVVDIRPGKIAEFRRRFPEQFAKLLGGEPAAPVVDAEFSEIKQGEAE
jgi:hypothetical protein